jgi:hypothetical protein
MIICTMLDCKDIIMDKSRLVINNMDNLLGGSHPREMASACTSVEIIEDSFSFLVIQTSMQNGIRLMSIENIIDKEITRGLLENASMIIPQEMNGGDFEHRDTQVFLHTKDNLW